MKTAPDSRAKALAVLLILSCGDDRGGVLPLLGDGAVRQMTVAATASLAGLDSALRSRALIDMTAGVMKEGL